MPKDCLDPARIAEDSAQRVLTEHGLLLTSTPAAAPSIEDEPAFAGFLAFLDKFAEREPARPGNVLDLTDQYAHLVEGVEVDDVLAR